LNNSVDISACKRGERNAQQKLFNHFAPYVFTICRRYTSNNENAKEAMQDCFLRVFNKLDSYDVNRGELKPWIAKLSVNVCLNKLRSGKNVIPIHFQELKDKYSNEIFEQEPEKNNKQELLLNSIQKLPTGYRNVLNLYVFEHKKHTEIASLLNISEGTSRSQLARAKTLLKKIIEKRKKLNYV